MNFNVYQDTHRKLLSKILYKFTVYEDTIAYFESSVPDLTVTK
uniref:Uncharacterized protein n=1 Tax=Arundo donax TaxID=35708 RepID=A0A0A9SIZ1_ARUDO